MNHLTILFIISFSSLFLAQEDPPLICSYSNSTLCETICSIRYNGLRNSYDIQKQECCSSEQCNPTSEQLQSELEFAGIVDDPEIICVNGEYFQEYGQCICNEGWYDSPHDTYDSSAVSSDSFKDLLYKCNTQMNPYADSSSAPNTSTLKQAFFLTLAIIGGCVLGFLSIVCVDRCARGVQLTQKGAQNESRIKERGILRREFPLDKF